jgi:hypothetical protein
MSEFTFNLDSLKGSAGSAIGSLETGLYAKTPDDKLTYSGTDPIIWDRTNNERLRRGLSPLSSTRPVDDGKTYGGRQGNVPTNTASNRPLTEEEKAKAAAIAQQFGVPDPTAISKDFTLNGPPGMTRDQAFEIFKKQANAGGLNGFSPGDVLSAQTQAKDGLESAKAELAQAKSGFPGTDAGVLNSFKSIVDTAKQSIAAGTTGTSLSGAVGVAGDILQSTAGKIGSLFGTPVTDGISTADFAKTASALAPMAGLNTTDVRATVAAAGKFTGQDFTEVTNAVGAGKYGFNATQLETAGLLKPGTASTFLNQGANDLTDVLKSPAVWTGKGGINNLDSLLSNPAAQNFTQQDLMSKGLGAAKSLGVPIDGLNPKDLAGVAANFGKSTAEGADWLKGKLPADKQADFDKRFADAKFAVGTAEQKLNDPVKKEAPPGEASDTTNRQTVDAAATRVVGNDKVPTPDYGSEQPNTKWVDRYKEIKAEVIKQVTTLSEIATTVNASLDVAANTSTLTRAEIQALAGRLEPIAIALYTADLQISDLKIEIIQAPGNYPDLIKKLDKLEANVKEDRAVITRLLNNFKVILRQIQEAGG